MGEFDPAPGATVTPPADEYAPAAGAAVQAPDAPPAPIQRSLLGRVASRVAQPFVDIGHGLLEANRAVADAIVHPVDTFNAIRATPAAHTREFLRGVNDNIPFANRGVEAIGGPPAVSPEDAAAAPGARPIGGLVGSIPAGEALGGIAAKTVEKAAPVVAGALEKVGAGAGERNVARAKEALELKVNKGTRAGLRSDAVDETLASHPELQKAAGNDAKTAEVTGKIKAAAAAALKPIYAKAGAADEAAAKAVGNMDARIAELKKGDVNAAAAAKKLQALRDEFNTRIGERTEEISASDLRAEQSAYQKNGYRKNIENDADVAAGILAQREMSKAVGDALVEHVTGMDYKAAKAAAAADPNSLAAKLFKANDEINAANKIEAGIADRAGRARPAHGPAAALKRIAAHSVIPAVVGSTHGAHAGIGALVAQEALHAAPGVARAGARAVDARIASAAPRAAAAVRGIGEAAAGGTPIQRVAAAARAGNPRAVKLLANLRSVTPSDVGTATSGTLATQ